MKRAVVAAAFAAAVAAAPAPSHLADALSLYTSASSTTVHPTFPDNYPSASSTTVYPTFPDSAASSGAPFPSATSSCAEAEEITYSIEAWENDVNNVNAFLNEALSLTGIVLQAAAQVALNYAQDEPTQLGIECALPNLSQAGKAACANLQEVFGMVIVGLEGIIADPDYEYTVRQNLDLINETRCKSVLPSLDVLWSAAADASCAKIYAPKAARSAACEILDGGAEEYEQGEKQGEGEYEKECESEYEKEGEGEKEGEDEYKEEGEDEYEKEGQAEMQEEFEKENEEKYEFEGKEEEGEKGKTFENEGDDEKQGKYGQEKRKEKEEDKEEWPGEKDGFPIFPLPPIRRVAKVPGFLPHLAASMALKTTESEKEGEAGLVVLAETPLASASPTIPTLFIPIPTQ